MSMDINDILSIVTDALRKAAEIATKEKHADALAWIEATKQCVEDGDVPNHRYCEGCRSWVEEREYSLLSGICDRCAKEVEAMEKDEEITASWIAKAKQ